MKNTINRICIIGGSGSGKTTLAEKGIGLSKAYTNAEEMFEDLNKED